MICLVYNLNDILLKDNNKIKKITFDEMFAYQFNSIFVICGPGNYTQNRINMSIGKGFMINQQCNIYGINILLDFCTLFCESFIYKLDKFYYIYTNNTITVEYNIDQYNIIDYQQNYNNNLDNFIDTSSENIMHYIDKIPLKPLYQKYNDNSN